MANLAKLEFVTLEVYGENYMSWALDAELLLSINGLGKIIETRNKASMEKKC